MSELKTLKENLRMLWIYVCEQFEDHHKEITYLISFVYQKKLTESWTVTWINIPFILLLMGCLFHFIEDSKIEHWTIFRALTVLSFLVISPSQWVTEKWYSP